MDKNLVSQFASTFKVDEISSLYCVFKSYLPSTLPITPSTIQQYYLDKIPFKSLLMTHFGFVDTLILDRIFKYFDSNNDNKVQFNEFVSGMVILSSQDVKQQSAFSFYIYDLNGDKYITKEEMMQLLNRQEEEDEINRELIEIALRKMDEDKDGRVSELDWMQSTFKEPLLLQAFGKCLPSHSDLLKVLSFPMDDWMGKITGLVEAIESKS